MNFLKSSWVQITLVLILSSTLHFGAGVVWPSNPPKVEIERSIGGASLELGSLFKTRKAAVRTVEPEKVKPLAQEKQQKQKVVDQMQAVKPLIAPKVRSKNATVAALPVKTPVKQIKKVKIKPRIVKVVPKVFKKKPVPPKLVKVKPKPKLVPPKPVKRKIVAKKIEPKKKIAKKIALKPVKLVKAPPATAKKEAVKVAEADPDAKLSNADRNLGGTVVSKRGKANTITGTLGKRLTAGGLAAKSNYQGIVLSKLIRNKHYPSKARRRGWEGLPTVAFTVLPNGSVQKIRVTKSSGHPILDRAVVSMVERSVPFPEFPRNYQLPDMDFEIPVVFKLH